MSDQIFARRPTLEAVAERAGVSRATVSRVVNGGSGVREALVEKVRRAVEELGYVPNQAARTLVTRRTGAVAVIAAEPETEVFTNPFFAEQLLGISRELAAHDHQLVLLLTEEAADYERVGRYLAGGHVDGAVLFSLHNDDPLPEIVRRVGIPTVFGGRPGWPGAEADRSLLYVDSDNRGGAREAVNHLISLGRGRIATITGPMDQVASVDRLDGYHDMLMDADPRLIVEGDFSEPGGARAMTALLDRAPELDAVFVASDLMALGALRVLRERGYRVPEDVAVVGFDDMAKVAEHTDPPLTTVRQDIEEMGRLMVRLLLRSLDRQAKDAPVGRPLSSVIIPTRLVRRATA
ncbi:LacI family DNA-binding transcriptional regulator [Streptomyces sp. CdTB01]|uniref:LacI family DNA-binding transcriptional regulator n=1 Tax=Streptomyces sp. CdTB01 TaxID=1725411 RepID=UPI00073A7B26|nr:LacI family DNA-binding transcriptional regulator [Streptomyces sp. CdTB01]ALV38109.1 LacI family transcriptional regulator [Streptomyces sp. CdTB01]NUR24585.1 LacI family transcriptional regulator [Catenulispora sp.]